MRLMFRGFFVLASFTFAPAAFTSTPAIAVTTTLQPMAISTGMTPVTVLRQDQVSIPPDALPFGAPGVEVFHLKMELTARRGAHRIHVVASEDPNLNDSVVTAVRHFHGRPAQLDHHNIAVPVDVTVVLHD